MQTQTIEECLDAYAAYKRTDRNTYARWAGEMHDLNLRWQMEGRKGSFLDFAAHRTGLGRTTIWRDVQAGTALRAGVSKADQNDLISAAECVKAGLDISDINQAMQNGSLTELRGQADTKTGTTIRRLTQGNAGKFDEVRRILAEQYHIPAPRLDRDEVVFDLVLYLNTHHPSVIQAFVDAAVQGNQR